MFCCLSSCSSLFVPTVSNEIAFAFLNHHWFICVPNHWFPNEQWSILDDFGAIPGMEPAIEKTRPVPAGVRWTDFLESRYRSRSQAPQGANRDTGNHIDLIHIQLGLFEIYTQWIYCMAILDGENEWWLPVKFGVYHQTNRNIRRLGFEVFQQNRFFLIPPFQAHDAGISKFDFNDDRELVATVSHVKPLLMSGLSWRVLQILIFDVGICASRIWACVYGTSEKAHHLEQASGLLTCCALMQICGSWSRGIPSRKSWCCEMDANSQLVRRCWRCGMEAFVQSTDSGDLRWFAKMSLMIGNRGLDYLI